jgi:hypothetical protein
LLEQQILSLPFHEHFIHVIKGLPLAYYDSLARALLILIPHDLPEVGKSPYGWESLAKKLQESGARSQDIMDLSKTFHKKRNLLFDTSPYFSSTSYRRWTKVSGRKRKGIDGQSIY